MVTTCPALRQCNICKEHKPQTDFYKVKRARQTSPTHYMPTGNPPRVIAGLMALN